MTTKADLNDTEWEVLVRAPMVAGMAITLADPGGPIEVLKETSAVLRLAATEAVSRRAAVRSLVTTAPVDRDAAGGEVARGLRELAQQRKSPLKDFKPRGSLAGKEI